MNETNWAVACSTLRAFKRNLPLLISEDCVSEYHAILGSLEKAGELKLDEYRINPLRLSYRLESSHSANASTPNVALRANTQYSNKHYCDTEYFHWMLSKLEAAVARSKPNVVRAELALIVAPELRERFERKIQKRRNARLLGEELRAQERGEIDLGEIDGGETDAKTDKR